MATWTRGSPFERLACARRRRGCDSGFVQNYRPVTSLRTRVKNALDEVRILVLGTQVLLGFAYRAFFEPRFERLPARDQGILFASLCLLLAQMGLLLLPAARHRIVEGGRDSEALLLWILDVQLQGTDLGFLVLPLLQDDRIIGKRENSENEDHDPREDRHAVSHAGLLQITSKLTGKTETRQKDKKLTVELLREGTSRKERTEGK